MTDTSSLPRLSASATAKVAAAGADAFGDRLLQAAVNAARVGMWELDTTTNVVLTNAHVREIYGLDPREPLSFDTFAQRIHQADRPAVLAKVEACLAGTVDLYDIEHRLVWPDGRVRWVLVRGDVLRDEQGNRTRMIGTMMDVTERKEAEQKLATHDLLLRQLIAHTPAAVAMFDAQMRYLAVSDRWITDYHLEGVELIGRSHYDVFPDMPEEWRAVHRRVLAGAVERREEDPFPRADGSMEWLQWEVQPWRDASGAIAGIIMFTQVITARKRAEEALARAEEKFARVFWSAPVAIMMTRVQDGLILDVNHHFERLFGYTREEAVGRTTLELGMWSDPAERARLAQRGIAVAGTPTVHETVLRAKDGALIPISNSAHALTYEGQLYMLSAFQDLRERLRSEAAIRASESRLRRVFASPIVGMAFVDSDGTIAEANAECQRILGRGADEIAHQKLNLHRLAAPAHQALVAEVLLASRELSSKPHELELLRPDGSRVPVMLGVSSVDAESGGQIAFFFDLSERRGLERQLLHAQRMEAVGRLAAGIAHDFNNVLSAITMGSELLGESLPVGHRGREDLREMRKAADRAVRLVRQLLAFSRQQILEPRVLCLNELLTNLEPMLSRLLGDQIELHAKLSSEAPHVKADPGQIEQMILNLVVNARDAMPHGGHLSIRTETVQLESEGAFDVPLPRGAYARLVVEDTGVGMDVATRTRMFEPFFTTKEQGKGTGLGLSTVYGIVRQSGGAIDVVSAPESGTTLSIYLPKVSEPVHASLAPPASDLVGGSETLLLVERDSVLRRTTRKLLVSLGYRVLEAEGAAAARSLADVYVGGIDLLLTELGTVGSPGAEIARELTQLRPKLRVLFTLPAELDLTSLPAEARERGRDVVVKPFASTVLAKKLRLLLDADRV